MNTEQIKKEADWLNNLDDESEEYKIFIKLFGDFVVGDTGVIRFTSNSEINFYKKENYDKEHIESLMITDRFIAIPFPDDLSYEQEHFMIFISGQVDGSRGETSNLVIGLSHIVEMIMKNDMFYEVEK